MSLLAAQVPPLRGSKLAATPCAVCAFVTSRCFTRSRLLLHTCTAYLDARVYCSRFFSASPFLLNSTRFWSLHLGSVGSGSP
ncbi:hypothetical protein D9619_010093 [Psilocybe cf. subviscida]|uniref:Uncharacterized protein n=1 Tax=Psilocybe cf. subviscida TaxID=2480587 RepID=A0A8H5F5Y9_9AGAR|nr:hypothetical protein D9619_010093 [Psilocybe cf. subviscida]